MRRPAEGGEPAAPAALFAIAVAEGGAYWAESSAHLFHGLTFFAMPEIVLFTRFEAMQ